MAYRLPIFGRALRPHLWSKNALLAVPALTGHKILRAEVVEPLLLAFVAFSLVSSSVYLMNDLADAESDRLHPEKKNRPIAAGELSPGAARGLALVCLLFGALVATRLPQSFGLSLGVYLALSTIYNHVGKRLVLIDVLLLAVLFSTRVIAGGFASGVTPSTWLLAFAMFFSIGLAFAKRYAELHATELAPGAKLVGRGYISSDLEVVRTMGVSSGQLAVLVFALYVHSPNVQELYGRPEILFLVCPVLLYWFGRLWIAAGRGTLDADPVVFALRDGPSWIAGILTVAVVLLARLA